MAGGRPRLLTDEQARSVVARVGAGELRRAVAKDLGVSVDLVKSILTGHRYNDATQIKQDTTEKEA